MDMLVREIGDRGRPHLSEAVPPAASLAPAAVVPAPAPEKLRSLAPAAAPAPAPEPEQSFAPSLQSPAAKLQVADALPLMERLLEEARAEKAELRAEVHQLRRELAPVQPLQEVSDEQLVALQARLEAVHAAKLLSDEEFFALEDLCADFAELQPAVGAVRSEAEALAFGLVAKMRRLVCISEKMVADAAFTRQARRKFLS